MMMWQLSPTPPPSSSSSSSSRKKRKKKKEEENPCSAPAAEGFGAASQLQPQQQQQQQQQPLSSSPYNELVGPLRPPAHPPPSASDRAKKRVRGMRRKLAGLSGGAGCSPPSTSSSSLAVALLASIPSSESWSVPPPAQHPLSLGLGSSAGSPVASPSREMRQALRSLSGNSQQCEMWEDVMSSTLAQPLDAASAYAGCVPQGSAASLASSSHPALDPSLRRSLPAGSMPRAEWELRRPHGSLVKALDAVLRPSGADLPPGASFPYTAEAHAAASALQSWWAALYRARSGAQVVLASTWRGWSARAPVRARNARLRGAVAALSRGYARRIERKHSAATLLQARARGMGARRLRRQLAHENRAVVPLQCAARRAAATRVAARRRLLLRSVILLQRLVRGWGTRAARGRAVAALHAQWDVWSHAAGAAARGWLARRHFAGVKSALLAAEAQRAAAEGEEVATAVEEARRAAPQRLGFSRDCDVEERALADDLAARELRLGATSSPASHRMMLVARDLFDELDLDASGSLDAAEVRQLLRVLGKDASDLSLRVLMRELDADGSGSVQFDELWAWWTSAGGEEAAMKVRRSWGAARRASQRVIRRECRLAAARAQEAFRSRHPPRHSCAACGAPFALYRDFVGHFIGEERRYCSVLGTVGLARSDGDGAAQQELRQDVLRDMEVQHATRVAEAKARAAVAPSSLLQKVAPDLTGMGEGDIAALAFDAMSSSSPVLDARLLGDLLVLLGDQDGRSRDAALVELDPEGTGAIGREAFLSWWSEQSREGRGRSARQLKKITRSVARKRAEDFLLQEARRGAHRDLQLEAGAKGRGDLGQRRGRRAVPLLTRKDQAALRREVDAQWIKCHTESPGFSFRRLLPRRVAFRKAALEALAAGPPPHGDANHLRAEMDAEAGVAAYLRTKEGRRDVLRRARVLKREWPQLRAMVPGGSRRAAHRLLTYAQHCDASGTVSSREMEHREARGVYSRLTTWKARAVEGLRAEARMWEADRNSVSCHAMLQIAMACEAAIAELETKDLLRTKPGKRRLADQAAGALEFGGDGGGDLFGAAFRAFAHPESNLLPLLEIPHFIRFVGVSGSRLPPAPPCPTHLSLLAGADPIAAARGDGITLQEAEMLWEILVATEQEARCSQCRCSTPSTKVRRRGRFELAKAAIYSRARCAARSSAAGRVT
jgi:hypothetical protein